MAVFSSGLSISELHKRRRRRLEIRIRHLLDGIMSAAGQRDHLRLSRRSWISRFITRKVNHELGQPVASLLVTQICQTGGERMELPWEARRSGARPIAQSGVARAANRRTWHKHGAELSDRQHFGGSDSEKKILELYVEKKPWITLVIKLIRSYLIKLINDFTEHCNKSAFAFRM